MGGSSGQVAASEEPLFYLLYETRPFTPATLQQQARVDHRLHVRSQGPSIP